jgi:hypothetical protein
MNIVSVLIFSHPELGYDKQNFTFPVDVNIKFPGNGSGLCNQIFRFINSLAYLNPNSNNIYYDFFSKDYLTGEMCKISEIIDINRMNEIYNTNLYDITELKEDEYSINNFQLYNDHYVFRTYHSNPELFKDLCKKIIWKKRYVDTANEVIRQKNIQDTQVNLVHLRIDYDIKKHIIGNRQGDEDYNTEYWKNRELAYDQLIANYESAIYSKCDSSKPLILLMEEITHPFVSKLKKDFDVIFFDKELVQSIYNQICGSQIDGREIYALIDLLIGSNLKVETFIGQEAIHPYVDGVKHASSFSILLKNIVEFKNIEMV